MITNFSRRCRRAWSTQQIYVVFRRRRPPHLYSMSKSKMIFYRVLCALSYEIDPCDETQDWLNEAARRMDGKRSLVHINQFIDEFFPFENDLSYGFAVGETRIDQVSLEQSHLNFWDNRAADTFLFKSAIKVMKAHSALSMRVFL